MWQKIKMIIGYLLTAPAMFVFFCYAIPNDNLKTKFTYIIICALSWIIGFMLLLWSETYKEDFAEFLWDDDIESIASNVVTGICVAFGIIYTVVAIAGCLIVASLGFTLGASIACNCTDSTAVIVISGIAGALASLFISSCIAGGKPDTGEWYIVHFK